MLELGIVLIPDGRLRNGEQFEGLYLFGIIDMGPAQRSTNSPLEKADCFTFGNVFEASKFVATFARGT